MIIFLFLLILFAILQCRYNQKNKSIDQSELIDFPERDIDTMSSEQLENFMRECIGYVEHQEEMEKYKDYLEEIQKNSN